MALVHTGTSGAAVAVPETKHSTKAATQASAAEPMLSEIARFIQLEPTPLIFSTKIRRLHFHYGRRAMGYQSAALAVAAAVAFLVRSSIISRGLSSSKPWGPRSLALRLAYTMRAVATMAGVRFTDDTEEKWGSNQTTLDPARQYLVSWHPHGAYTFTPAFIQTN